MDDDRDLLDDDLPEETAGLDDSAAEAPEDDAPPDEFEDAGDEATDAEDAPPEDPQAELTRLRQALEERDRADRERAERDAVERQRQQAVAAQQAEQARQQTRQQAWQVYQSKKAAISQQRLRDHETIRQSDDPATVARFLEAQRRQEEATADWEYSRWQELDRQAEQAQLRQALERASTRDYAEYVRGAYKLPADTLTEILTYRDGTPVDPSQFAARAAEIADRRKEQAALKRQMTRLKREQTKDQVRGATGIAPGRGHLPAGNELEGTIEELRQLFPMRRDLLRRA